MGMRFGSTRTITGLHTCMWWGRRQRLVLSCFVIKGAVRLMDNYGFSRGRLNAIAQELIDRLVDLCDAWGTIHG